MGPVYYVIAIFGCADGSTGCVPAATVPVHYGSREACAAATADALAANSDLDFPTVVAECRPASARPASSSRPLNEPAARLVARG